MLTCIAGVARKKYFHFDGGEYLVFKRILEKEDGTARFVEFVVPTARCPK